jgi:hypothetical protein
LIRAKRFYGWPLLACLGLISIVAYGTLQYVFAVLVVPVGHELGWSRSELSLGYSLAVLVAGLLGYPVGRGSIDTGRAPPCSWPCTSS